MMKMVLWYCGVVELWQECDNGNVLQCIITNSLKHFTNSFFLVFSLFLFVVSGRTGTIMFFGTVLSRNDFLLLGLFVCLYVRPFVHLFFVGENTGPSRKRDDFNDLRYTPTFIQCTNSI